MVRSIETQIWRVKHVQVEAACLGAYYTSHSCSAGPTRMTFRMLLNTLTQPSPDSYALVRAVFVRLLGIVYLIAFASFGVQMAGLVGSDGILPAAVFLERVQDIFGARFLPASANCVLGVCVGRGAHCRNSRRTGALGLSRRRIPAAGRARGAVRALPVVRVGRAGIHGVPVGHAVAGGGVPVDLPRHTRPRRGLALPSADIPVLVPFGRGQAPERRPDVELVHGPDVPLRNAAPANLGCLVRPPPAGGIPSGSP